VDLAGFLGKRGGALELAEAPALHDYLAALTTRRLAPRTLARRLSAMRQFFRFLVSDGARNDDPTAGLDPPRLGRPLPKTMGEAAVEQLIETAADWPGEEGARLRALLELLYGTGLRVSELVGLPLAAAQRDPRFLLVRGKGGKERIVPVGRYAREAVSAYLTRARPELVSTGSGTPALFLNARGGRLSRQSAWTVIVRSAERAGVSAEVSPHTMRHSYATHLLEGGADVRVVQELLGHASVTTTQVYTLVTVDSLREVYAAAHPRALS
jgi:integrase/recombinase XerD